MYTNNMRQVKFNGKKINTVIIFGFSGSGKSTMADALGQYLGWRVVHPSSILRNLLENKKVDIKNSQAGTGFWESTAGEKLFKQRLKKSQPMDIAADKILLKELARGKTVMDSWSMPWLFKNNYCLKIYLKASKKERIKRVAQRSNISLARALKIVSLKDEQTRKMYKRTRGFDIKKDLDVFDFVLDTTKLSKVSVAGQLKQLLVD